MKTYLFYALSFLFCFSSFAIENNWNLGSSCSVRNNWTENALNSVGSLVDILKAYQDDNECKNELNSAVTNMTNLQKALAEYYRSTDIQTNQLHDAVVDLTNLVQNVPSSDPSYYLLTQVLAQANIEYIFSKRNITSSYSYSSNYQYVGSTQDQQKMDATLNLIQYIHTALHTLPSPACLVKMPNQLVGALSAAIQVGSAFTTGWGPLVGSLGAQLISTIANSLRDTHFQKWINKLEAIQLQTSVQCAIETVSSNWCSANEMQKILYTKAKKNYLKTEIPAESYWAGYLISSYYFPQMLSWFSGIIGFLQANREADAQEQNEALNIETQVLQVNLALKNILSIAGEQYRDAISIDQKIKVISETVFALDSSVIYLNRRNQGHGETHGFDYNPFKKLFLVPGYDLDTFIYWILSIPVDDKIIPRECQSAKPSGNNTCLWDKLIASLIQNKYSSKPDQFFIDAAQRADEFNSIVNPQLQILLNRVRAKDKILHMSRAFQKNQIKDELSIVEEIQYLLKYLKKLQNQFDSPQEKNPVLKILLARLIPKIEVVTEELEKFSNACSLLNKDPANITPGELEKINTSATNSVEKIAQALDLHGSRLRFISSNIQTVLDNDYTSRIKPSDLNNEIENTLRLSNGVLLDSVRDTERLSGQFISIGAAKMISEETLTSLSEIFDENLSELLKTSKKRERRDDRMHSYYNMRARLCVLLNQTPVWPEGIDRKLCQGIVLPSIYNMMIPIQLTPDPSYEKFRDSLNIYLDQHMKDSFEDRACIFYNYLRKDQAFQFYRRVR